MRYSKAIIMIPPSRSMGPGGNFRTKQAGRTGLGSVMGDKNIRAVVILGD